MEFNLDECQLLALRAYRDATIFGYQLSYKKNVSMIVNKHKCGNQCMMNKMNELFYKNKMVEIFANETRQRNGPFFEKERTNGTFSCYICRCKSYHNIDIYINGIHQHAVCCRCINPIQDSVDATIAKHRR